jgi:hypothetical protein
MQPVVHFQLPYSDRERNRLSMLQPLPRGG